MNPDQAAWLDGHRAALLGHCYRMLGAAAEADDAVQETMVRAWMNRGQFQGRSSIRTWLTRIATRVCLDALEARNRRTRPRELGAPPFGDGDQPSQRPAAEWVEPIADAQVVPADASPAERIALRQSIRLAFVAALQHLPPRQRAVLLLTEVLDWPAAEVAESLDMTVAAVNSALQRARATLAGRDVAAPPAPLSDAQTDLVERYVDAFERYDLAALSGLLHREAVMSMPPYAMWFQGPAPIAAWMAGPGAPCRGSRLVRVEASGTTAFAQYRPTPGTGGFHAWALFLLDLDGEAVREISYFLDVEAFFPRFGLPLTFSPGDR